MEEIKIEYEYKIIDDYVEFYLYMKNEENQIEKHTCYCDLADWDKIKNHKYKWYLDFQHKRNLYIASTVYLGMRDGKYRNKKIILHRFLFDFPDSKTHIDHRNNNQLDNRRSNLRITINELNTKNRKGKNKNNTSGYRNVSWIESYKKWCVQLQINGKNTLLGKFDDVDEAGEFATQMRRYYYKDYAGRG